ncbi:hypothetical protein GTA08_BOTSDO13054 [Neofusicoccum parvum]|nr:hypothetical protein GTA08_BOTSDO13054 [Neofusicoccum parvum]
MATTEHPSGQWSCIPPWETTLLSFQYTEDTKYSVKFEFKRGGQEYIYQTITSVFPNLYYANLKDENIESALEQATFHQAIRILDPAFARMEQPSHVMRMLRMSHTVINLSMEAAFQNSCKYTEYIDRIYQIPYGNPSKLPLHDWNQFQVIETFKDGFKVQARAGTIADAHSKGEVYGCVLFKDKDLAADGAYLDYLRALDDLRSVAEMNRFDDDNDEEDDEDDGEDLTSGTDEVHTSGHYATRCSRSTIVLVIASLQRVAKTIS